MKNARNLKLSKISSLVVVAFASAAALVSCSSRDPSYSRDVAPLLAKNCNECHAPGREGFIATEFDTTSYQSLMKGGKFGPLVKPGDAFTSALNMLVEGRANPKIQMPHGKEKLAASEIELLKNWVNQGAKNN